MLKFLLSKIVYNYFFFYILKFAHEKNIKSLLNLIYPAFKFKPKQKIPTEYYSKISNYSIKLIDKIISDPEFELNRIKRKENNQLYLKLLFKKFDLKMINITDFNFQNFLDFPIIAKSPEEKQRLVRYLFKKGLETRSHFYSDNEKYTKSNINDVSKIYENNILCLPSHPNINENKIREYCKEIKEFYLNEKTQITNYKGLKNFTLIK